MVCRYRSGSVPNILYWSDKREACRYKIHSLANFLNTLVRKKKKLSVLRRATSILQYNITHIHACGIDNNITPHIIYVPHPMHNYRQFLPFY